MSETGEGFIVGGKHRKDVDIEEREILSTVVGEVETVRRPSESKRKQSHIKGEVEKAFVMKKKRALRWNVAWCLSRAKD